jgi:hypothetical protein
MQALAEAAKAKLAEFTSQVGARARAGLVRPRTPSCRRQRRMPHACSIAACPILLATLAKEPSHCLPLPLLAACRLLLPEHEQRSAGVCQAGV